MKALSPSHHWTRRFAPLLLVLALLALPLLVYAGFADSVVNWAPLGRGTGATALAIDPSAPLNDSSVLASSVTGGKTSRLDLSSPSAALAATQAFTYTVVPANPTGNYQWYRSNVTVTWVWIDAQPPGTPPPCPAVSITADQGPTTYNCTVGTTTITTNAIKRDTKVDTPVITGKTADGKALASGDWTNQNLTVTTVTPTGDLSGIVGCNPPTRSYTVAAGQMFTTNFTSSCMDYAGNSSNPAGSFAVRIDKSAPMLLSTVQNPPATNGWNNTDVTVFWNWKDPDGGAGLDSANCTTQLISSGTGTINLPADGPATCMDKAGNKTTGTQRTLNIDKTPPQYGAVSAINVSDGSVYRTNTWTKSDVQVSFVCSDTGGSGLATTSPVVKTYSQETAGVTAVAEASECKDVAGNSVSGAGTWGPIKIDKTPPKAPKYVVDPAPNAAGWNHDTKVTVTFVSDGDQGVGQSGGVTCTGPTVLTQETTTAGKDIVGTCTDAVGWPSDPTTVNVKIDFTPPVYGALPAGAAAATSDGITAFSNNQPYTAGTWTNALVEVHFQCSDALSGPDPRSVDRIVDGEGANLSATADADDCKDIAGNVVGTTRTFAPIKIDKTHPVINYTRTPGANPLGWNNSDVTVSFTCTDALSGPANGITNPLYSKTLSGEGAGQQVTSTGNCKDQAGNPADPATVTVGGINIDKTPPDITATPPPGSYLVGCNTPPTFAATDNLSGVVDGSLVWKGPVPTGPWLRFTATAEDKAGNVVEPPKTFDYLAYSLSDPFFLPPVEAHSTSLFNLGSVIPIKFQLRDCTGKIITDADARIMIVYKGPAAATTMNIKPMASSQEGDTGDQFHVNGNTYQYNWKTKGINYTGDFEISVKINGVVLRSAIIGLR